MENALLLLAGSCSEEKIAGVLLSSRLLRLPSVSECVSECDIPSTSSTTASHDAHHTECVSEPVVPQLSTTEADANTLSLSLVIKTVGSLFLIRMMKNPQLCPIALPVLRAAEDHPAALALFAPHLIDLYNILLQEKKSDLSKVVSPAPEFVFRFLTAVIKVPISRTILTLLFQRCSETLSQLTLGNNEAAIPAIIWLGNVAQQLCLTASDSHSPLHLSAQGAANLRGTLLHGWRGSTKESCRDTYLVATKWFLRVLHPNWTLESLGGDIPQLSSKEEDEKQNLGHFASLVCSISCGEFRILCDEFVSVLEAFLPQDKKEGNESKDATTEGESGGVSACVLKGRHQRIVRMHDVCFDLFNAILELLVGEGVDQADGREDSIVIEEEDGGAWATLPATCLMKFRNEMSSSINLYFEVIKEASRCLAEASALRSSHNELDLTSMPEVAIRNAMACFLSTGMECFSKWMFEDDTLYTPFLDQLSDVLSFSRISLPLTILVASPMSPTSTSLSQSILSPEYCLQVIDVLLNCPSSLPADVDKSIEERDVFVSSLPMLLRITDIQDGIGGSTKPSNKLQHSASSIFFPLLMSSTVCLLQYVDGDVDDIMSAHCQHKENDLNRFEKLIAVNKVVSLCYMCVQVFANIMSEKVKELYGSSKSLSKGNKLNKEKGGEHIKDDNTFSDEMVTEYLGISSSGSETQLLLRALSVCMHTSGKVIFGHTEDNDSDDECDFPGAGGMSSCKSFDENHSDFANEIMANKDVLKRACGSLFSLFQEAYSSDFFNQVM